MQLKGEDEPKFEMISDLEFGEAEKLQSQPTMNIEVTQQQPQQLKEVGRHDVATQEPTPLENLVEAATQMEIVNPLVYTIYDYNLGDLEENPE